MICKHGIDAHDVRTDREQWLLCHRAHERKELRNTAVFVVLIVSVIVTLKLLHAYLFYGDLSCAFADCRKVIDVSP